MFDYKDAQFYTDYFSSLEGFSVLEEFNVSENKGPLEKVCGYRSTIKILFCPFIKLNNG